MRRYAPYTGFCATTAAATRLTTNATTLAFILEYKCNLYFLVAPVRRWRVPASRGSPNMIESENTVESWTHMFHSRFGI
jgi:hypothetical protein